MKYVTKCILELSKKKKLKTRNSWNRIFITLKMIRNSFAMEDAIEMQLREAIEYDHDKYNSNTVGHSIDVPKN